MSKVERTGLELDRGDVLVEPIVSVQCEDCEDAPATHMIKLDLRMIGTIHVLAPYLCESCATKIADAVKSTLPEPLPD